MFVDARLKAQRGLKHIEDFTSGVISLGDRSVGTVEEHALGKSIRHECPALDAELPQLSLIAGDALHNLRSALDLAWIEVLRVLELPRDRRSFPFYKTKSDLQARLLKDAIDSKRPNLFVCLLTQIRPHLGGDDVLYALHQLDIVDKHILRLKIAAVGGVEGIQVRTKSGIHEGATWASPVDGPRYIDFHPDVEIVDKGKLTFSILFDESPAVGTFHASDELNVMYFLVNRALDLMESSL